MPLETVTFWGIDLLADVEIEIESELEDLEIEGCSELLSFRKLLSREEKLSAILLKVEYLHFCEVINLRFLFTLFFSEQKISGT